MVPVVKKMNWGQPSPFIFLAKISLLPDGSARWLPEEMLLSISRWGKNFHLEQERAFIFHQKGGGLRQCQHSSVTSVRSGWLAGK